MNCRCIIVIIIIGDIKKKGKKFNQNINRKKNLERKIQKKDSILDYINKMSVIGMDKIKK